MIEGVHLEGEMVGGTFEDVKEKQVNNFFLSVISNFIENIFIKFLNIEW